MRRRSALCWLPQWPQTVGASPYVSAGAAGGFERPQGMSARRWAVLWPRIEAAIWAHARDMVSADLASRLEEGTLRVALGPALYAAAAPGVARSAWTGDDAALVAALVGRIDQAAVDEVWSAIYRSVELRPPVVRDVYHGTHRADGSAGWRLRSGAADLLVVASGGSAQLLTYDFSAAEAVELSGEFALPVTADEFLSFTLPLRQDRSWHGLQVALELDGKRYVAADALYLGQYRWQEMSFKIAALDDRDRTISTLAIKCQRMEAEVAELQGAVVDLAVDERVRESERARAESAPTESTFTSVSMPTLA